MGKFTQRHYEDVAKLFRDTIPPKYGPEYIQWGKMQTAAIDLFARDNVRFNSSKFFDACYPKKEREKA